MAQQLAGKVPQSDFPNPPAAASTNPKSTITVPAGTKISLSLSRPLWARSAKAGDVVYSVTVFPVAVGNEMAIPPGTYVEGKIDALKRPRWLAQHAEFQLHFTKLVFVNGYTVELADVLENLGSGGNQASSSNGVPAQLGLAEKANTPAADIEAAVAHVYVEVTSSNDVLLDNGAPIEMILQVPLRLDGDAVAGAVQGTRPPQITATKSSTKCVPTAGTVGTPDTVIPGSPGTPPTVIPGPPGFPDTVIPGTPATPATVIPGTPSYPGRACPGPPIVTSEPSGKDAHTKTVTLPAAMKVGGTLLTAGTYELRWTGEGPTAQVEILENKKPIGQAAARIVILGTKSPADHTVQRTNADGSVALESMQFAGETFALFFD